MPKLTRDGLDQLRKDLKSRRGSGPSATSPKLTVHLGTCGLASGAGKVLKAARSALHERGAEHVLLTVSGCAGLCCREPMATVELAGGAPTKYADLDERKIVEIIDRHLLGGEMVPEYALALGEEKVS